MAVDPPVIIRAKVHHGMSQNSLFVEKSDGVAGVLFWFYPEESVNPDDYYGLTTTQAMALAGRPQSVEG